MDVIGATLILAVGLVTLGIGLLARVRNVALAGVGNILAGSLLFPSSGLGIRHYVTFVVLIVLVFVLLRSSLTREAWRGIRFEVWLGLTIIANIWISELIGNSFPRQVQFGLLTLLAILTMVWIGLILAQTMKGHFGQGLEETKQR